MTKLILMCAGLLACGNALADDFLSQGGISRHFDRNLGYNEVNYGLGLERDLTETLSLGGGVYKNSLKRASFYLALNYHPINLGSGFRLGANLGAISGYQHMAVVPAVMPSLEWRGSNIALQVILIPTVKPYIDGAVGLQFKYVLGKGTSGMRGR